MPPADRARDAHGRAAAPAGMSCPVCGAALEPRGPGGRDRLLGVPGRFAILVCAGCGLGVTSPDLSEAQLEAHYPERYAAYAPPRGAPAWLIGRLRCRQMDQRLRREPYASIVAARRGRVLDVGCGRGDFAAAFVRRGWHAAGLDISPLAVQQACEVGVEAFAGTLDSAPWEPGSFDLVVMFHCLEHMRDPVGALERAKRLLRPGGHLVVTVPDFGSWQSRRFRGRWYSLDVPRHLTHFTAPSLLRAAARAGLADARVDGMISMEGLLGSVQYALAGRCVFRGGWLWPALGAAVLLYPLTWIPGRLFGGDWARLVARRPP